MCVLFAVFKMELEARVATTRLHVRDGTVAEAGYVDVVVEVESTFKRTSYCMGLF